MQTHFTIRPLEAGPPGSYVLLAVEPSQHALVFIHGYYEDAVTTWSEFDALLQGTLSCCGTDVFFYGYDGLFSELMASSAIFTQFLTQLLTSPSKLISPMPARSLATYRRVTIVAHSLGDVID